MAPPIPKRLDKKAPLKLQASKNIQLAAMTPPPGDNY